MVYSVRVLENISHNELYGAINPAWEIFKAKQTSIWYIFT